MKSEKRDFVRIKHIYDAILLIKQFTGEVSKKDFLRDELIQSAVIRQFEVIGEAASNVSVPTQELFPEIEWRLIKDFRNLLIHEYFRVDANELWFSIKHDIPVLEEQIYKVINEFT